MFHLHDLYVLHALPLHVLQLSQQVREGRAETDISTRSVAAPAQLHVRVLSYGRFASTVDLTPDMSDQKHEVRTLVRRFMQQLMVLAFTVLGSFLLSAFIRRLIVLSMRVHIYSSYTSRQMRRFAFIAEPLRRINCYSSNELLELWTAWIVMLVLVAWLLLQAWCYGGVLWIGSLLCYALAEYWGIVHVRTRQSRWIFPRVTALLYGGTLLYATSWPLCPPWLTLSVLSSSQLCLMLLLLCHFDGFVALPEDPPHRLFFRSLLMPASQPTCEPCVDAEHKRLESTSSMSELMRNDYVVSVEASRQFLDNIMFQRRLLPTDPPSEARLQQRPSFTTSVPAEGPNEMHLERRHLERRPSFTTSVPTMQPSEPGLQQRPSFSEESSSDMQRTSVATDVPAQSPGVSSLQQRPSVASSVHAEDPSEPALISL